MCNILIALVLIGVTIYVSDSLLTVAQRNWIKEVTRYEKVVAYLGKIFGRKGRGD
jgi:hypothetical protein